MDTNLDGNVRFVLLEPLLFGKVVSWHKRKMQNCTFEVLTDLTCFQCRGVGVSYRAQLH
jgi:hypothetical protein